MLPRFCKLKEKSRAGYSPSKPGWLQGAVGSAGRAGGRCSTGQLDNSLVISVIISVLSRYYLIVLVQPLAPGSCATPLMAWKRGLGLLAGGSLGLQQSRQEQCQGLREPFQMVGGDRDTSGWVYGRGHPSPCKHTSIVLCLASNPHYPKAQAPVPVPSTRIQH